MTIGDVLGMTAGVIAVSLANWALLIGMALLFGQRAAQAQLKLEARPWRALGTGIAVVATAGLFAIILLNQPNGLLKLIGWVLLVGLLAVSALGGGGLALLVSNRIRRLEPHLSAFAALGRGAGILAIAGGGSPVGWFVIIPLTIIISLGAGCQVLWQRARTVPRNTPQLTPVPAAVPPGNMEPVP